MHAAGAARKNSHTMDARQSIQLEILRRLTGADVDPFASPVAPAAVLEQPVEVQDLDGTTEFHVGGIADGPESLPAAVGASPEADNAVSAAALKAVANGYGRGQVFMAAGLPDVPVTRTSDFFSIRGSMAGATVLLTGATGYLGQLVLEQLLRTVPDLRSVLVLSRSKKDCTAHQRIDQILYSGLFHAIRGKPKLLAKVVVIEGDLLLPNMGLSPDQFSSVLGQVTVVIHSAARIALEDAMGRTLRNNYCTTDSLLQLASQHMPKLKSFVYVSSAFVNMNVPNFSIVTEAIHPLMHGDQEIDHASIVAEFLSLSEADSRMKEAVICKTWGYPNTYTFGKHLSEQLVRSYTRRGLPGVIIRPSLVSAVAGRPYPGFVGNLAGPAGMAVAFGTGFYSNLEATAWHPHSFLDAVPGDVASSMIIAAAALRVAGFNSTDELLQFSTADTDSRTDTSMVALDSKAKRIGLNGMLGVNNTSHRSADASARIDSQGPLVLHSGTSTVNPFTHGEANYLATDFFTKNPPENRIMLGKYPTLDPNHEPDPKKVKAAVWRMSMRVKVLSGLLTCFGSPRVARKLKTGFTAFKQSNDLKYDTQVFFSSKGAIAIEAILDPEEADDFPVVWRGDWRRYGNTYCAGVCKLFLRQDAVNDGTHDFVYISAIEPPSAQQSSAVQKSVRR